MSRLKLLMHLSPFLVAHLFVSGINSTYDPRPLFYVTPTIPTGFSLGEKDGKEIKTSDDWVGHLWGRTHCTEDDTGRFSCITGDCGSGKIECSTVPAGSSPVTMAEFKINNAGLDFFNVSLLDGYNLPLLVLPSNKTCKKAGCVVDLNGVCPSGLTVNSSDGKIAGCRSACEAFGSQQYCCTGEYETPSTCKPTSYSQNFKKMCPSTYTYPLDDETGTFSCASSDYQIVFCAGNTTEYSSPAEPPPSPPPQVKKPPRPSPEIRPKTPRSLVPIIAGVIGSVLLIISFVVIFILRARWRGQSEQDQQDVEDHHIKHVPGMPVRFSYQELYVATDNFNERLGRGGFGSVFKGKLGDGTQIAVKRLEKRGQGMSAFLAEAEAIGSLHHFNLVRLIGFCAEKSSRLLVFEYLSNGSLDNWIFMNVQRSFLDWQTRKKIILDIAKGLAYLHEDCRHTIIHLDVKPQNILLDSSFHAKIADFGLSKLINRDMSQVQISMRGTPGYLAPEWRQPLGHITVKVDIYSFGIVLLEIVCARRNADQSQPESAFHLLTMLQKKGDQDRVIDIVENLDEYTRSDREEITTMIKVAAWCLQDDPERRPLMSTVLKVLEGVMEVDSNINYRFSHAMISSPAGNNHISSAPPPASVLSNPR
ncbi:PR5-like receptor kinase [Populus nigra]|uniref:PR5-like receptor kinase n=1 Tax=Populus nigra TaxID=3691 RepID=UPI002B2725DB|nr:PR5-like receptor kinase [Populus nigra]